ncbi:hypothetical protein GCM10010398_06800 [Streptomyces fimbriatus]
MNRGAYGRAPRDPVPAGADGHRAEDRPGPDGPGGGPPRAPALKAVRDQCADASHCPEGAGGPPWVREVPVPPDGHPLRTGRSPGARVRGTRPVRPAWRASATCERATASENDRGRTGGLLLRPGPDHPERATGIEPA